jgi:AraC-like DNA-binding protein
MQNRPPDIAPFSYLPHTFAPDFPIIDDLEVEYRFVGSNLSRPHIHNCLEIGYCHKGKGLFKVGGKVLPYKAGDIAIINSREAHIAYFIVDCIWSWLYLEPGKFLASSSLDVALVDTDRLGGADFVNIIPGKDNPEAESLLMHIMKEVKERKNFYRSAVRGLVLAFMACLHRIRAAKSASRGPTSEVSDQIERIGPALEYIQAQFRRKLSVEAIAKRANMSPTNFSRIFRRILGVSPHKYIAAFRINMACAALKGTVKSVEVIAYESGFEDPSAFSRAFKQSMGTAPGEWRKAHSAQRAWHGRAIHRHDS